MSYVDQRMGSGRIASIVIVAILHALLGYVLVTGMAYKVVKKAVEDLKTFDVNEEPPPPEEKPPPPEKIEVQPPPIVAPPPIVRVNTPPPSIVIPTVPVAPPPVITPTAPPAPPPRPIQTARVKGSLMGLFSSDDYPDAAYRAEAEGSVRAQVVVGPNGKVTSCTVIQSSGNSALDSATCRIIRSRARYTPATDASGNAISSTTTTEKITWRMPKD